MNSPKEKAAGKIRKRTPPRLARLDVAVPGENIQDGRQASYTDFASFRRFSLAGLFLIFLLAFRIDFKHLLLVDLSLFLPAFELISSLRSVF
jgi:hypothetical protein